MPQKSKWTTGGCITMGQEVIHTRSSKQTINSKSSTETELMGGSDYLPYALWYKYLYKLQGYNIDHKFLLQDNESTIKLLKNGQRSSGNKQDTLISDIFGLQIDLRKRILRLCIVQLNACWLISSQNH